MAEQGIVKPADAAAAARRPLGVTARPAGAYFPAYLDFVRRTLRRDYHEADLTEAGLRIYTSLEPRAQDESERALEQELARLDKQKKHPKESLEGAVVVTAPQSGDVIAIVGGRDVGYDGFDRALDAHRSMGSLVKPFIYLTALESGRYNATTVVQDAAGGREARGRQALEAGELHPPGLRPGAGGARAGGVLEPRHRRGGAGLGLAQGGADVHALRPAAGARWPCRRCCWGRSMPRRWRSRSCSTASPTAASATRCARCAR